MYGVRDYLDEFPQLLANIIYFIVGCFMISSTSHAFTLALAIATCTLDFLKQP